MLFFFSSSQKSQLPSLCTWECYKQQVNYPRHPNHWSLVCKKWYGQCFGQYWCPMSHGCQCVKLDMVIPIYTTWYHTATTSCIGIVMFVFICEQLKNGDNTLFISPCWTQSWKKSQASQACLRNQLREIEEPFWDELTLNVSKLDYGSMSQLNNEWVWMVNRALVKQSQFLMRHYQ